MNRLYQNRPQNVKMNLPPIRQWTLGDSPLSPFSLFVWADLSIKSGVERSCCFPHTRHTGTTKQNLFFAIWVSYPDLFSFFDCISDNNASYWTILQIPRNRQQTRKDMWNFRNAQTHDDSDCQRSGRLIWFPSQTSLRRFLALAMCSRLNKSFILHISHQKSKKTAHQKAAMKRPLPSPNIQ